MVLSACSLFNLRSRCKSYSYSRAFLRTQKYEWKTRLTSSDDKVKIDNKSTCLSFFKFFDIDRPEIFAAEVKSALENLHVIIVDS